MRKAFNFYKSYDDVISELSDKQALGIYKAISDVQFFRKKIDEITFDDKILTLVWKSLHHSILKQIEGYCNSKSVTYDSLFIGVSDASVGAYEGASVQEQGQGEEQGQVQGEGQNNSEQVPHVRIPTKSEVLETWNENAKMLGCPILRSMSNTRYNKFKVRLKHDKLFLDNLIEALEIARNSEFIMKGSWFSFDWLVANDENYLKVLEGNYSGRQK